MWVPDHMTPRDPPTNHVIGRKEYHRYFKTCK